MYTTATATMLREENESSGRHGRLLLLLYMPSPWALLPFSECGTPPLATYQSRPFAAVSPTLYAE